MRALERTDGVVADASVVWAGTGANAAKPRRYAWYSGLALAAWATQMRGARSIMPSSIIVRKPASSALTLPRLPPGMITQSGSSQPSCCAISIATVF